MELHFRGGLQLFARFMLALASEPQIDEGDVFAPRPVIESCSECCSHLATL